MQAVVDGAGTSDAQSCIGLSLHPFASRWRRGFVVDAEGTMLSNKDDPRSIKVFDPSIKGETDRFAYRSGKL
ncbi:MAG: methyltransferase [Tardiphaga sp.]|nr:methyltransferase [Tardiphaga sp.]